MVSLTNVVLIILATFIGSVGSIFIKKACDLASFWRMFLHWKLWLGGLLYALSTVVYIFVLGKEELSVAYPLVSTSFLWTTLLSVFLLKEKMNVYKWLALSGIIVGIVLIGIG